MAVAANISTIGPGHAAGWLTRIEPRARILAALAFAVVTVACDQIAVLVAALGLAFGLLAASGLDRRRTLRRMAAMDTFILFMLVLLPFTVPGEPVFSLWGWPASREGIGLAIRILLTANAVILALMALVGTLEPVSFGHALHHLKVPARLVHLMLFTIRYIDVLHQEYRRLRQAMKARGFRPKASTHVYRSFGYLVGMMLVRAMERSERILAAMKCRGFTGQLHFIDETVLTRRDWLFLASSGAVLLALAIAELALAV